MTDMRHEPTHRVLAALSALLLRRRHLGVEPGYRLKVRQMPTIGPRDGLPVRLRARA